MAKIYIAGPMTGYVDFNFPAFHAAATTVRQLGHDPLNPATSFAGRQDLEYADYIREALRMVLLADAMLVLEGWWESKGALLEIHTALVLGLPLYILNTHDDLVSIKRTLYNIGELLQVKEMKERYENCIIWQDEVGQDYASGGIVELAGIKETVLR